MLKFNTQGRSTSPKLPNVEWEFSAQPFIGRALKSALMITLLCGLAHQALQAQCTPDVTAPTAQCVGPFTIALNSTGQAPLTPGMFNNGSSDNCGAVTLSISPNMLTCAHLGLTAVTLTVTDLANNTNTCVTNVTVVDNLPPVVTCPSNVSVACGSSTMPSATGTATAVDNCGGILTPTFSDTLIGSGVGCTGISRTWSATHASLTGTCTQTITVFDNVNPVIDWNGASPGLGSGSAVYPNLTVNCNPGPPAIPVFPSAPVTINDICDPTVTDTVTDVSTQGANPALCNYYNYVVTRTFKAQDDCGNFSQHVQTITVQDVTAPVVTAPASINLPAGATCQTSVSLTATVLDNCAPNIHLITAFQVKNNVTNLIVNSGTGLNASGIYPAGTYTVTFSAIDPCGNQGTATTALNIADNVAPTAICQASTIQLSIPPTGTATLLPSQVDNGSYDNCTPTANLVLTLANATFTCADVGLPSQLVTLTVKDANGNTNTCSALVSVVNNSAPAVFCKNLTVQLGPGGTVNVLASALDDGSFDACDSPAPLGFHFVKLNSDTIVPAVTSLTFNCSQIGVNNVRVRIREVDNGQIPVYINDGFCNQTITVQDVAPPTPVCNNITIPLSQNGMASIFDVAQNTLVSSSPAVAIPDCLSSPYTPGTVSTIINIPASGSIADVNVTLNIAHTFVGDLSATLTSPNGTVITLFDRPGVPPSSFGCSGDDLVVTFDYQAPNLYSLFESTCSNLPAISGTFQSLGSLASFNGENLSGNWTLTVTDFATNDSGSIISWSLDIDYNSYLALAGAGTTDNCSVTWTVSPNMYTCANIDNNPNIPGNQPLPYTLTATDQSGNTATCTGLITVTDPEAPVISCEDRTLSIGPTGTLTVLPTDFVSGGMYLSSGNNGSSLPGTTQYCITAPNLMTFTFDWDFESQNTHPACDPFGYTINGVFTQLTSGVNCVSGPVDAPLTQTGTATVTLQAGQQFCFQVRTVDNILGRSEVWITNFSPTFTGAFAPGNWAFSNTTADGKGFFYDACGISSWQIRRSFDGGSTWSAWGPNSTFNCSHIAAAPPILIEIRATDVNGNTTAPCQSVLTVIDKQAPQAQCQPLIVTLNSGGTATVPAGDFNFGSTDICCGTNLTFTASKNNISFSSSLTYGCADIGTQPVTLKVTDCAPVANEAYCVTTITIQDKLPPSIVCPADITINCSAYTGTTPNPTITGLATATDNCAGTVTPTFTDMFLPSGGFNDEDCRIVKRTWTASDNASPANTSLCFQNITIIDNVKPDLDWNGASAGLGTAPSSPIPANPCAVPAAATPTGTDNCDENVALTYTQADSRFACGVPIGSANCFTPAQCGFYNYTLTRTWSVVDNCGNTSSYQQIVNVSDNAAPTFSFPAMFMFNNNQGTCSGTASINLLDYINDCAAKAFLTVTYQIDAGPVQTGSTVNSILTVGSHTLVVKATDPCGNMATTTPITIVIKDNESPVAICQTGPIPVTLNSSGIASISAAAVNNNSTDNCGIVSYMVNPAIFDCNTSPNPKPVVLTVTDGAGNFNTCTTSVIITNASAPTIICPSNVTVSCSVFVQSNPATSGGSATASTACGPVTPTYTDVTISGVNNCRTIHRTWSATSSGGTATCLQVITVVDNTPPSLVGVPANTTANACAIPAPAVVTATDNCVTSPGVTYGETSTQNGNPAVCGHYNYTLTRTWTTTDNCNSPVSASQTISVSDVTAPAITIPNPLIINTDPLVCQALVNINLWTYITDCAADQYLTITNNAPQGNGANIISGTYLPGDYTVTVTAKDPCNNMSSQTFILRIKDNNAPQAACLSGVTLILNGSGNGSLTVADIDNSSVDNCGIASMSINPSTFNTSNVGVVNVVLTVTDAAGNSSQCTTPVTVIERGTISASSVTGGNGTTVSVPITVTGFDNLCAASFSLHVVGTAGSVTGVGGFNLPGMSMGDFSIVGNNIAFSWVSGVPVSVPDGTAIFHVNVFLSGAVGSTSNVNIDGSPTSVNLGRCDLTSVPVTTVNGMVTVVLAPSNITLAGNIRRENNENVQLANVAMTGSVGGSQTTGVPGNYSFTVPSGSNETITPTKDINDCNGVNVLDVLAIQAHILNNALLPTPYRRIAADINNDGNINVLDRLELHLIVLNGLPCIGFATNTSWRFVPVSYAFPDPLNPFSPPYPQSIVYTNVMSNQLTGDFIGIKIGDLDLLGLNPSMFTGGSNEVSDGPTSALGNGTMFFSLDDQLIQQGQEYRFEVKAKDFHNFVAYQFSLGFDPSVLKYKGVEMGALPELTQQHFGTTRIDEGLLTGIWYSSNSTSLDDDAVLFTLVFDAVKNGGKLSSQFTIQQDPLVSAAFDADLTSNEIALVFNNVTTTGTVDAEKGKPVLRQNRPNPFSNETTIGFYLPVATHATLTITDVSGKIVRIIEGDYNAGNHEVNVSRRELPSTGVFFYRLETQQGTAVRKMILTE